MPVLPTDGDLAEVALLHGNKVAQKVAQVICLANRVDLCIDFNLQSLIPSSSSSTMHTSFIEFARDLIQKAKKSGTRIRCITEVTKENISYTEELAESVELRHLSGLKSNFVVSNTEYIAITIVQQNRPPAFQAIYINNTGFVHQQQYLFETLWNKSSTLQDRTKEIHGDQQPEQIRIIDGIKPVETAIKLFSDNTKESQDVVVDASVPEIIVSQFMNVLIDNVTKRGIKVRLITEITRNNIEFCKLLLEYVDLRHIKGLKGNFSINEMEILSNSIPSPSRQDPQVFYSNASSVIEQNRFLFDTLWAESIPGQVRIKEIEDGVETANIEIIASPSEALQRAWDITRNAHKEILQIYSSPNAVRRQIKMVGSQGFKDAVLRKTPCPPNVRILIPNGEGVDDIVKQVNEQLPQMSVRIMDASVKTNITIHLVDRNQCLIFELKDDTKQDSHDAIGVTMYSNSKSIVSSYVAIFESLWKQTELYEDIKKVNSKISILNSQLSIANAQLKTHEKMQKEFINIAAHELKTPMMPIMAVAEIIESKLDTGKRKIVLNSKVGQIIVRNAKRLEQLSQDILDVTRIESNTLRLNKQMVNIKEIISTLMLDFDNQLIERNIVLKMCPMDDDISIEADKGRLNQIIANILSNAIKFTENGVITINARKVDDADSSIENDDDNNRFVIISIKDTGSGINPEVLPILFKKFATKSEHGMGLGLYISKNFVEAHGGKIWAENNRDGAGATFTFMIPMQAKENVFKKDNNNNNNPSCCERLAS